MAYHELPAHVLRRREALLASLRESGIDDAVLAAMADVPRQEFVSEKHQHEAWEDHPLPIGSGQTISQPFIVAYMTQQVQVRQGDRVLDVGTGCGYQAAVLAASGAHVTSIEVREDLARAAADRLERLGYRVHSVVGDGSLGYPPDAPYDGILVAAATRDVPAALVAQLRPAGTNPGTRGGRMILPLDTGTGQVLVLLERTVHGLDRKDLLQVRFVPLISTR